MTSDEEQHMRVSYFFRSLTLIATCLFIASNSFDNPSGESALSVWMVGPFSLSPKSTSLPVGAIEVNEVAVGAIEVNEVRRTTMVRFINGVSKDMAKMGFS
jgi:hypothetical protein